MIEPRNTPCSQSKASVTSGTVRAAPAAEQDRRDRHARRVLPLRGDRRALRRRRGEAGVGVGGRGARPRGSTALPFQSVARAGGSSVMPSHHTSPSSVSAVLVKMQLPHSVSIALGLVSHAGAGGDAEEAGLGVDRVAAGRRRRTSSSRCRRRPSRPSSPGSSGRASPGWSCRTPTGTRRRCTSTRRPGW